MTNMETAKPTNNLVDMGNNRGLQILPHSKKTSKKIGLKDLGLDILHLKELLITKERQ